MGPITIQITIPMNLAPYAGLWDPAGRCSPLHYKVSNYTLYSRYSPYSRAREYSYYIKYSG